MKSNLFIYLSIILMNQAWSEKAHAVYSGGMVGNGGNAIVCYTSAAQRGNPQHIVSVEMFDYWEMSRLKPNWGGLNLGNSQVDVKTKIDIAAQQLASHDPARSASLKQFATGILDNLDNYLGNQVFQVFDDNSQLKPQSPCFKEQFAIQYRDPEGRRRFLINKTLYLHPKTTNDARAGLILHEAIYREAIKAGQNNSDSTREFNYAISSKVLNQPDLSFYDSLIKNMGLEYYECYPYYAKNLKQIIFLGKQHYDRTYYACPGFEYSGPMFKISTATNVPYLSVFKLDALIPINTNNRDVLVESFFTHSEGVQTIYPQVLVNGNWVETIRKISAFIRFGKSGNITHVGNIEASPNLSINYFGKKLNCDSGNFKISEKTNRILGCRLAKQEDVNLQGKMVKLRNNTVLFNENMGLVEAILDVPATLKIANSNRSYTFRTSASMTFNPQGEVLNGSFINGTKINIAGNSAIASMFWTEDKKNILLAILDTERLKGYRLMSSSGGEKIIYENVCRGFGYVSRTLVDPHNTLNSTSKFKINSTFISASETFYDLDTGKLINVVDENVFLVDRLTCYGVFENIL